MKKYKKYISIAAMIIGLMAGGSVAMASRQCNVTITYTCVYNDCFSFSGGGIIYCSSGTTCSCQPTDTENTDCGCFLS